MDEHRIFYFGEEKNPFTTGNTPEQDDQIGMC